METTQYLSNFLSTVNNDPRIAPIHISIYAAILHLHAKNDNCNPVLAYSYEVMKIAKISTKYTCLKGINHLNTLGYIKFRPTKNKNERSKIYI